MKAQGRRKKEFRKVPQAVACHRLEEGGRGSGVSGGVVGVSGVLGFSGLGGLGSVLRVLCVRFEGVGT